jgi:hypothetical protein
VLPVHTGARVRRLFEDGSGAYRAARRRLPIGATVITTDGDEAVRELAAAQRRGDTRVTLTRYRDGYRVSRLSKTIDARDRFYYEASYRVMLPGITAVARLLPYRVLRALANRADRREAEASYADGITDRAAYLAAEARRVGILQRMAIDRYDVRSDTAVTYYFELRRRSEGS